MRDDVPQKLPRHVFRRVNGSYRYKRNVPVGLRKLLGKDTIYRQLGNSHKEAMGNLPLVHGRIEALFDQESKKSVTQRSLEIIRGALGDEVAEIVLVKAVPEYSEIVGLEVRDVDPQERSVALRPNGIRGIKTRGSNRAIPLSRRAAELLRGQRQGKEDGEVILGHSSNTVAANCGSGCALEVMQELQATSGNEGMGALLE